MWFMFLCSEVIYLLLLDEKIVAQNYYSFLVVGLIRQTICCRNIRGI